MSGPGHSAPFEHLCPIIVTVTSLTYQVSNCVTLELKLVLWEMEDVFFFFFSHDKTIAKSHTYVSSWMKLVETLCCGFN